MAAAREDQAPNAHAPGPWLEHAEMAARLDVAAAGIDPALDADKTLTLVRDQVDRHAIGVDPGERDAATRQLMAALCGFGPIQRFLDDPAVEEIWINSPSRVFVARGGQPELTTLVLDDRGIHDLVERMLQHSGRRLDLSSPFVDATLRGGERLHAVIPPVVGEHWSVNIRKHIQRARSLGDLVAAGMLPEAAAQFLAAAMRAGLSVIVSGATQAGKTTTVRALAGEIPRSRRVITIEEVFELALPNRDCVALQTRMENIEGRGEVSLRALVKESLRMRPDVIVVGEVRGAEALDMLLALNAGVPGMATVHANSARDALTKLTLFPLLAGENVTEQFIVPTLAASVDVVVHVDRDRDGARKVTEILGIPGSYEGGRITTEDLWVHDGTVLARGRGTLAGTAHSSPEMTQVHDALREAVP